MRQGRYPSGPRQPYPAPKPYGAQKEAQSSVGAAKPSKSGGSSLLKAALAEAAKAAEHRGSKVRKGGSSMSDDVPLRDIPRLLSGPSVEKGDVGVAEGVDVSKKEESVVEAVPSKSRGSWAADARRVASSKRSLSVAGEKRERVEEVVSAKVEEVAPKIRRRVTEAGSLNEYEMERSIASGAYGRVFLGRHIESGREVALKQFRMDIFGPNEEGGFPIPALREIGALLSLSHPNVVGAHEVVEGDDGSVFLVLDYFVHDLRAVMDERLQTPWGTAESKCLLQQLLRGVAYMHERFVIHRDLKSSNILLDNDGRLAIADFGLARRISDPPSTYTRPDEIVTLWYRAPELLLGMNKYGPALDMWSVGCIFYELVCRCARNPHALFVGNDEVSQLRKISAKLGPPTLDRWPDWTSLPVASQVGTSLSRIPTPPDLRESLALPSHSFIGGASLSDTGFDLLLRCLTYDPAKRITAKEALQHPFFTEPPLPCSPTDLPKFEPVPKEARARRRTGFTPPPPHLHEE